MAELDLSPEDRATIERLVALAESDDHYALLAVSRTAEPKQIQAAFYDLSRRWHPDRFFRKEIGDWGEQIENVFVAVTEAYRILGSDTSRKKYDLEHRSAGTSPRVQRPETATPDRASATGGRRTTHGTDPFGESRRRARQRTAASQQAGRSSRSIANMREQVLARLKKARRYYLAGKADYEEGNVLKASTTLALATTYDPKNATYKALADRVRVEARKIQSKSFVNAAEAAESFANWREALANYKKAVEYGTENPRAFFRLGVLVRRAEDDRRQALTFMRQAVTLEPDNIEYLLGLGELYSELGLTLNARSHYERVRKLDKTNEEAKARLKAL
jgi:curved DNA-binding protein CbpA